MSYGIADLLLHAYHRRHREGRSSGPAHRGLVAISSERELRERPDAGLSAIVHADYRSARMGVDLSAEAHAPARCSKHTQRMQRTSRLRIWRYMDVDLQRVTRRKKEGKGGKLCACGGQCAWPMWPRLLALHFESANGQVQLQLEKSVPARCGFVPLPYLSAPSMEEDASRCADTPFIQRIYSAALTSACSSALSSSTTSCVASSFAAAWFEVSMETNSGSYFSALCSASEHGSKELAGPNNARQRCHIGGDGASAAR